MIFEDGQKCWGGPNRSCRVSVRCGFPNGDFGTLSDVKEPSKCVYSMTLTTPFACTQEDIASLNDSLAVLNSSS